MVNILYRRVVLVGKSLNTSKLRPSHSASNLLELNSFKVTNTYLRVTQTEGKLLVSGTIFIGGLIHVWLCCICLSTAERMGLS